MNLYLLIVNGELLTTLDPAGRPIYLVYGTDEDAEEAADEYGGEILRVVS